MDLETKLRENYVSHPMQPQEIHLKSNMKDHELPFGVPSSQGFLQDLLHIDPFHVNGSSSNPFFWVQKPFDNFTYEHSPADYDAHEYKHFVENNGCVRHAHAMDNFQYGGYGLNLSERNQLEMMAASQSYVPFDSQETMPMNFVVTDEVSCISPDNYYARVGKNKVNKASSRKVRNKSNVVKGQWTIEEDRLLIQLVEQYGVRKWSHIAQMLPGRIGKQCRERWHNHLRPDIKKDTWTNEEDTILIEAHVEIGNKWAEIAKRLPGRTENSIKNHWNATKRRQYSKRKCRSKYPRGSLLQDYIKSLNLDQNPPKDYRKRSSSAANTNNNAMTSTKKASTQPHSAEDQFCPNNDRLVSIYDFNEVPDFCFDENLFQERCSIDSLLDEDFGGKMLCASVFNVNGHHFESEMGPMVGVEVKKEMDLVEMMSQVNEVSL